MTLDSMDVVEASIADLAAALADGTITSVGLVAAYLNRIGFYDRHGIRLNAVPVLNPSVFEDARASDERRERGESLGLLDGIPYTAKDSYAVRGLTVAAGSPAFENLVAGVDAFAIEQLRAAGAVLIGLTNMPPMANGGMQRGVYGRAESPYNADYLTAAFASGSSNGSGTATAASFAAFGLGEETWSSGRAPASNNGLVAYTPSRGVISVRGNWPLVPTMDVVVPHTRTIDDLLAVLDVLVADDADSRGDLWRTQPWVSIPAALSIRPSSYFSLRDPDALRGKRLGIPRMYINGDAAHPIETRASVIALWEQARADLVALGAEVVEVDFPVVTNYESGVSILPDGYLDAEIWELSMLAWNTFLEANGDPALHALADVDGPLIFPQPTGALPDRYGEFDFDIAEYATRARANGITPLEGIPHIEDGLRALERTREVDLEEWMATLGLDAVIFPAVADVGPADADTNPASADLAWRNGTWVANGNQVIRHLGIPTVTVTMGTMADIGMPVGLTFAGRAYDDSALISYAWAFEAAASRRTAPPRTPALVASGLEVPGSDQVAVHGTSDGSVRVWVNGVEVSVTRDGASFSATAPAPPVATHSEWRGPYGSLVVVIETSPEGTQQGSFYPVGGL